MIAATDAMRMKFLLIIAVFVSVSPACAEVCRYRDADGNIHYSNAAPERGWRKIDCVSPEWTDVAATDDSTIYVDFATVRRSGNIVKIWTLTDYEKEQYSGPGLDRVLFRSSKSQREYDCKEERSRLLAYSWFSGNMGAGNVVVSNTPERPTWAPVQPRSVGEALWKIACQKK